MGSRSKTFESMGCVVEEAQPDYSVDAVFEVESGLKLTAFDVSAASVVRTEWYRAVRKFFEKYDYFIVPTAQVFPFDVNLHWPREIAGRQMSTYHEWMQCVLPITMSGCPALAAEAAAETARNRHYRHERATLTA